MAQTIEKPNTPTVACCFQSAAIISEQGDTADSVIERVIAQLRREGKKVVGLRQYTSINDCLDGSSTVLNIESGSTHSLSDASGADASCYTVNSKALERTAKDLLDLIGDIPDLIVINRFGQCESDGGGFCCVITQAIEQQIPLLTVVNSKWQQNWHDYAPGHMTTLPPSYECVLNWCRRTLQTKAS